MSEETPVVAKRKGGWPKGVKRGEPRIREAPIERQAIRQTPLQARYQNGVENADILEDTGIDRFKVPPELLKQVEAEGYTLQWVTDSVYEQPQTQHRAGFNKSGWEPVHPEDFGGIFDGMFSTKGAKGEINVGGQVLHARPKELTDRAKLRDKRNAREAVAIKEAAWKSGNLPGVTLDADHKSAVQSNRINRSVERIEIPE